MYVDVWLGEVYLGNVYFVWHVDLTIIEKWPGIKTTNIAKNLINNRLTETTLWEPMSRTYVYLQRWSSLFLYANI